MVEGIKVWDDVLEDERIEEEKIVFIMGWAGTGSEGAH